jgi:uncharacterized protein
VWKDDGPRNNDASNVDAPQHTRARASHGAYITAMSDPTPQAKPCPICGKPAERAFRPFCSRRCADVDLHRWLTGAYAVPVVESDDIEDEEGQDRRGE